MTGNPAGCQALQRVIWRTIPSAGNRRALMERGDADISFDLPPKDVAELAKEGKLKVVGTPIENAIQYIGMLVTKPPFDNVKVRQAVAYALPYQKIMDAAMFGRGKPMFGGPPEVTEPVWPQPHPYTTDLAKAKQLLSEAGYPDGFETTLSSDLGFAVTNEPLCDTGSGKPRADRDQGQPQQDSRRQLARRVLEEDPAVYHQRLWRLAQLS